MLEEMRHVGMDNVGCKVLNHEGNLFGRWGSTQLEVAWRDVGVDTNIRQEEFSRYFISWTM